MSVTKVLGLLVHKVSDDKKEKVRELGKKLFGSVNDISKARDIANQLINDRLLGAEAYLVAEPNGEYKTTSYGDLWHYPAEPQSADQHIDGEVQDASDLLEGSEPADPESLPKFEGEDDL
jgi:hypothetical protein